MILNDKEIKELARKGMIQPFVAEKVKQIITSYPSVNRQVYAGDAVGWIDVNKEGAHYFWVSRERRSQHIEFWIRPLWL
jgi:deoxycytidine triphosphate deaminase